jgi:hypothetical protein
MRMSIVALLVSSGLLVCMSPYWTLLLAPLCLGIPHVLCEIYLLICQSSPLPSSARIALAISSLTLVILTLILLSGITLPEEALDYTIVAILVAPLAFTVKFRTNYLPYLVGLGIGVLTCIDTLPIKAIFAHLHNILACFFLLSTFCTTKYEATLTTLLIVVAVAAGSIASLASDLSRYPTFDALTLGFKGTSAHMILGSYAVMQLIHFAIWIWFLPRTVHLYSGLIHAIKQSKVTATAVVCILCAVVILPISALALEPQVSRSTYLALVSFHVWMEISWILTHAAVLSQKDTGLTIKSLFSLRHCADSV